jgi:acyl-CoA synthetase (AMP-forming)/AMP-acid ligase II
MSVATTRVLHDRLLASLAADPRRPVARSLPDGGVLDLDTFERRLVGAERRLVRIGAGDGRSGVVRPEGGEIVLLSARNLEAYLVAVAVLWKRGFVPLLADADLSRAEIVDLVAAFRPAVCILDRRAGPPGGTTEDLADSLAGLHAWIPPRRGPAPRVLPGAAAVRLTSGTTGGPRGVVVTPEQLLADARQITATMGIAPGDTMVAAIPLGHAYGFVHVLMALVLQGTRPLLLEQPLPALLVEALSGDGPLVLPGTPYLFDLLLQAAGRRRLKGLRLCLSAGSPLPERLSREVKERFGLPVRTFYGASECGGIAYDRSRDGVLPDGCVGTPLHGVEVTVRPEPGFDPGYGRICVTSGAVAEGYLPPGPSGGLKAGRFVTSDLGRMDETGRLHLAGRIDRLINVGGRKVNPVEVERLLRDLPGVREAVVFGIPDRHRGQSVSACVVASKGVTREGILDACRARLALFKIPRRIEFTTRLPLTARGKTDHRALAALISPGIAPRAGAPRPG